MRAVNLKAGVRFLPARGIHENAMSKVVVSVPELGVRPGGVERNKELYVIGLAADLRGRDNREQAFFAAQNETLPNVFPQASAMDAFQWVFVSASNLFQRVRPDQPASLSGSGIILYPNLDPKGMLGIHLVVVESDQGTRDLGQLLSGIFEGDDVQTIVGALALTVTPPLVGQLMNTVISRIPAVLQGNKDDSLFSHSHSGFGFDDYGVDPGTKRTDFKVGNDRAFCTLRIRVND